MELLLIEATYQQALKAKDNPTAFKTAASVIMPQVSDNDGTKPALSSRTIAILQREPVETNIHIGQGNVAEGLGDKGHEGADRVHPVADGQRQDITFETLPSGHDTVVYGVHEGGDSAQGSAVPDTEVPPQDPVDNDSGNGMGALE